MQLTPAQLYMSLMIHGSVPMMTYKCRAEGMARARKQLIAITYQDFGYDLFSWHNHLLETNAGGYKWANRHRGFVKAIEVAMADSQWQQAVDTAIAESLLERLNEKNARQREAVERAEREWAGKPRYCPKCSTKYRSVRDRGQCPNCGYIFYASHPAVGKATWWLDV